MKCLLTKFSAIKLIKELNRKKIHILFTDIKQYVDSISCYKLDFFVKIA